MNELICKDVSIQDNIKDEFYLYYIKIDSRTMFEGYAFFWCKEMFKKKKSKYLFLIQKQNELLDKYDITNDIQLLVSEICKLSIPEKYKPIEKTIIKVRFKTNSGINSEGLFFTNVIRDDIHGNTRVEFVQVIFNHAIISLLEQKFPEDESIQELVSFFKKLNCHDGKDFDTYISDWSKRLLQEDIKLV